MANNSRLFIGALLIDPKAVIEKLPYNFTDEYIKGDGNKAIYNYILSEYQDSKEFKPTVEQVSEGLNIPASTLLKFYDEINHHTPTIYIKLDSIINSVIQEAQREYIDEKINYMKSKIKDSGDLHSLIEGIKTDIDDLQARVEKRPELKTMDEVIEKYADDIDKSNYLKPIETGVFVFDSRVKMYAGDLHIIGARAGTGKSQLALWVAISAAMNGRKVAFFSIEMTEYLQACRSAAFFMREDSNSFLNYTLAKKHTKELLKDYPKGLPFLWDFKQRSVEEIDKIVAFEKLELIVVDYLQQVKRSRLPREEAVAKISLDLKMLAKRRGCVVIALSQLNRQAADTKPTLANLRESGAIEQDADSVLLLHQEDATHMGINIAKYRMGKTGEFILGCDLSTSKFWEDMYG